MAGESQSPQSQDSFPPPPEEIPDRPLQEEQTESRRRRKPKHDFPQTQAGKLWDAFGNPEQPANALPGGTYNTAGGRPPREYSWRDVFSLSTEDANRFWRTGCANDALTVGILGGGGVVGAKFIWGGVRQLRQAANWGVGTFTVMSLGIYTWCERRRRQEAIGMTQAVAGMKKLHDKKKEEEKAEQERAGAAARLAEEERQKKSWTNLKNYKFW